MNPPSDTVTGEVADLEEAAALDEIMKVPFLQACCLGETEVVNEASVGCQNLGSSDSSSLQVDTELALVLVVEAMEVVMRGG